MSILNVRGEDGNFYPIPVLQGPTGPKPVKGVDFWTPADQEAIVQQVVTLMGMHVVGVVGVDNTITLSGELAEGSYVLRYEDADGNVTEIGTLNHVNVSAPTYTNLADQTSADWLKNKRINSSGELKDAPGWDMTNFITMPSNAKKVHIKGLDIMSIDSAGQNYGRVYSYDSSKTYTDYKQPSVLPNYFYVADYDSAVYIFDVEAARSTSEMNTMTNAAYLRFGGMPTAQDIIITIDEEIMEDNGMGDSGSIDLIWADGVKLDKNTGAEGSDVQYAASQMIDLVDGYTYTARQSNVDGWTTGGISICYYGEGGSYLGYEELWSSVNEERTKNFTPPDGTVSFRVRLFRGEIDFVPERYSVTYEQGASYKNLADPTSEDWVVDKRLDSSAVLKDAPGCHTTNFFPCVKGNVIRVKGLDIRYTNSEHTQNARAWFYNSVNDAIVATYPVSEPKIAFDGVDTFTITLDGLTNISGGSEEDVVKGRLSGMLFDGYTKEDIVITKNQEIVDGEVGGSGGMGDAGSIELTWADGVKLDKNTGAEGSGDGYAASQHIELVDGYTYTFAQDAVYGGVNICYYDADGNGLGYELLWDAVVEANSKVLTPVSGAATFRVRLYYGTGNAGISAAAKYFRATYEKTV